MRPFHGARETQASYRGNLAVCVKTNQGGVIERLLQSDCSVYPVHPPRAKQYRQRKISSGNKTDFLDAWALADALRIVAHRRLQLAGAGTERSTDQ